MPTTERLAALRLQLVVTELSERIGRHIRRRRIELGLNQRELADRVVDQNPEKNGAVTNQTVSNWERGVNEPGAYYKGQLAVALDVDVSYFVAEEPKGKTPDLSLVPADDEDSVMRRVESLLKKQNDLLDRQSQILDRIEKRLGADEAVRDELADLIQLRGREIVEGLPPASVPDPTPEPPRSPAAAKKRATKPRTASRPA